MRIKARFPGSIAVFLLAVQAAPVPKKEGMSVQRQPVLVELFTSEGCSSCPPADALLGRLDREQPVAGAQIIVLSEHVDYWNHLGWTDPFSSPIFTERQEKYSHRFGLGGPYTPQMIVDGTAEFNGSDVRQALKSIRQAQAQPKAGVRIRPDASPEYVVIEVDALPGKQGAGVYVTQTMDAATSDVLRGENRGRTLHHVSIAEGLHQVGTAGPKAFQTRVSLDPRHAAGRRVVAFVQEPGNGRILGAAIYQAPGMERR